MSNKAVDGRLWPMSPAMEMPKNNRTKTGDLSLVSPLIGQAIERLPAISITAEQLPDLFKPNAAFGDVTRYAFKRSLGDTTQIEEPVSQLDFANAYLRAGRLIVDRAQDILQSLKAPQELLEQAEQVSNTRVKAEPSPLHRPNLGAHSLAQDHYEDSIRSEILRLSALSAVNSDPELQYRGACLALSTLRGVQEASSLQVALQQQGAMLALQAELLNQARASQVPLDVTRILKDFCRLVETHCGYFPEIILLSDYDGNFTYQAHEGSKFKPGEWTNQLLNPLESALGLTGDYRLRLVLTECPGLDSRRAALALDCFDVVNQHNRLFADIASVCEQVRSVGGHHEILTANNIGVPRQFLEQSGVPFDSLVGLSPTTFFSEKISRVLAHLTKNDRLKIIVISDDDEGSLARHIAAGPQSGLPYLPDLVFFSSRTGNPPHGTSFRVAEALNKSRVQFIQNEASEPGGPGLEGLSGFLDAYSELKFS